MSDRNRSLFATLVFFTLLATILCAGCTSRPLVIGHRGASGYRPEHTLASYELAIEMGADFIEPDLVMTKDGILIVRHENEISGTTDVAVKFPDRKRTKVIDGTSITGWFSEDFTLKEIKELRAKERLATRDQKFNGQFEIPTFSEVIALTKRKSIETGRQVGVYAETKHPSYFSSIQLPLEPAVVSELKKVGWVQARDPIILQSFELTSLRELRKSVGCRLVYLYEEGTIPSDELKKLSELLYGIGPWKNLIIPTNQNGELLKPTNLVSEAHKVGLMVHPYTFRSDAPFLNNNYSDPSAEYRAFFELGVDGVFSDFPDHAVKAREELYR